MTGAQRIAAERGLHQIDGFSLHAAVVESRLVGLADGRVGYVLKKRWRDGTTHMVMTKEVLMERLCALVPRPRRHLVTSHEVLAPAAGLRSRVVPQREVGAASVRAAPLRSAVLASTSNRLTLLSRGRSA